jgi:hypothetical protein
MRPRYIKLGVAATGLAAIGMAAVYIASPGGDEEEAALQGEEAAFRTYTPTPGTGGEVVVDQEALFRACVPSDLPPPVATPVKNVPFPDPDAGLTDAERTAKYEQLEAEHRARFTAWLECLDFSKLDLELLPRGGATVGYLPGEPTLAAAVDRADAIVLANVAACTITPSGGVEITLDVQETLKGDPASTLVLTQGTIQPTEDWSGAVLVEYENAPMLFPGDRAVLFLQKDETGYYVQSISGWYQVVDGKSEASPLNPWGSEAAGGTEAQFIELIRTATH